MSLISFYIKNYTGNAKVMPNNSFSHIIKTINQSCFDGTNSNLKKTDLNEVPHTTNNYVDTANMVSEKSTQAPMKHFITCSVPLNLIGEVIWSESR